VDIDAKDFVTMAAITRKDSNADLRPNVPHPHRLVLASREQDEGIDGVEAELVHAVPVPC
tara:strand:- start:554 stop:733 length:180 start_codon:yes stop_codon:yes gene_type:complete